MIGVRTNVASLVSQRHLSKTSASLKNNLQKLTSGYRINSAADDAAGLAVSEQMKSDIRSLGQASRNANDAISMVQTAEGALGQIHNILGRMRELLVQSNSDGINADQRAHIATEFQALTSEVQDIAMDTSFNGRKLLSGGLSNASFQVGIESADVLNVSLVNGAAGKGFNAADLSLTLNDVSTTAEAVAMMAKVDTAIDTVSKARAKLGATQNRLDMKIENLAVAKENVEAANSRIRDVDVASEMADMTKNQILMQAGSSMLAQANALPQTALSLLG